MKKYLIFIVSFGMLFFLSACGVPQADPGGNEGKAVEEKRENLTSSFGEQLSWIPNGYTGAIAIITEANSGDVVIQTGDQLLYRNEIYGFQVLLGRDWKGVEISKDTYRGIDLIVFLKKYNGPEGEFESDFPIFILTAETFYKDGWDEEYEADAWSHRKNNHYFFRPAGGGISHFLISYFFPSIPCVTTEEKGYKERLCEHWLRKIFSGFSAFDI